MQGTGLQSIAGLVGNTALPMAKLQRASALDHRRATAANAGLPDRLCLLAAAFCERPAWKAALERHTVDLQALSRRFGP
jgi:hypothetical protein